MSQLSLEDFLNSKPATPEPIVEPATIEPEAKSTKAEEPQVLSVSDLNRMIRGTLEGQFSNIWLQGEISNFKPHTSGHFYFSLKDSGAQISAVMFRGFNQKLKFKPDNGMEVIVRGRVTVYEPRGNYQIFCEVMEPVGLGALQMQFEQLKAKLQAEGLFDPSRKKALPFMPKNVAIVTSPTGAAIRDMLNVLSRRASGLAVTVIPAVVQGAQAPAEIVRGIELAQKVGGFDVLIVGRGGGSMEDLWGFNDETVARAIANCKIPIISAVGHEIDFTIADFVADLRAPTPSAAAELVVRNKQDLVDKLKLITRQLVQAINKKIQMESKHMSLIERGLIDPRRRLQDFAIRCDDLLQRLEVSVQHILEFPQQKLKFLSTQLAQSAQTQLERKNRRLARVGDLLDSLSPLKVVARGYSLVTKNGDIVKSASTLKTGDKIEIQFAKGRAEAQISEVKDGF